MWARALFARELGELLELAPAPLAHGIGELVVEVGEEAERLGRAPLLAHEQERDVGREQEDRLHRLDRLGRRQSGDPLAERAVADLIVILDEGDERDRRQMTARLAAPGALAVVRDVALVDEARGQRPGQALVRRRWRSRRSSRPASPLSR